MKNYLDLLKEILENGSIRDDRTGVGTISLFGKQLRFKISDGFPIVTTRKMFFKNNVSELLWMLEGSSNVFRLAEIKNDNKPYSELSEKERRTIWDLNYENQAKDLGYSNGDLGPIYGFQWRNWTDQISKAIDDIKNNPTSRRIMVSAWNVEDLDKMSLPPCHYGFQFYVDGDFLSLMWNQRSADMMLGVPSDIAVYALLLQIVAKMTNKIPFEVIGNFGDTHIYKNHIECAKEQLKRKPRKLPDLILPDIDWNKNIDEILKSVKTSDFQLLNYEHDDVLKMPMAV